MISKFGTSANDTSLILYAIDMMYSIAVVKALLLLIYFVY
jgi:hypothetical protein